MGPLWAYDRPNLGPRNPRPGHIRQSSVRFFPYMGHPTAGWWLAWFPCYGSPSRVSRAAPFHPPPPLPPFLAWPPAVGCAVGPPLCPPSVLSSPSPPLPASCPVCPLVSRLALPPTLLSRRLRRRARPFRLLPLRSPSRRPVWQLSRPSDRPVCGPGRSAPFLRRMLLGRPYPQPPSRSTLFHDRHSTTLSWCYCQPSSACDATSQPPLWMLALSWPFFDLSRPYVAPTFAYVARMLAHVHPMLPCVGPILPLCWPYGRLCCCYVGLSLNLSRPSVALMFAYVNRMFAPVGPMLALVSPFLPRCWPYGRLCWCYVGLTTPYVPLCWPRVDLSCL